MINTPKFFTEKIILKYKSSIGNLEFRYIAFKDIELFRKLDNKISDKNFSIKVIFNQLKTNINVEEFLNISNNELEKIIKQYSKKSNLVSKYYSEINSKNVFLKFKKSILSYLEGERKRRELLIKSINKQFEPMKKMLEQSTAFSKSFSNITIPKIPIINISKIMFPDFSNQFRILNNSFFKIFEEHFKLWENFTIQYERDSKKSLKNLKKYNWFINSSMPASFIAETAKVKNSKEMKNLFILYHLYDNYKILDDYCTKWFKKHLFKKRIKILRDVINIFKENYENKKININAIIIPVLINQIEGIKNEYMKSKKLDKITSIEFRDKINKKKYTCKEIFIKGLKTKDEFTKLIGQIFEEILFQNDKDKNKIINFSRHKISHGVLVKYGNIETTIRCFMILEFLSNMK